MRLRRLCALLLLSIPLQLLVAQERIPEWKFKTEFWPELVRSVPEILRSQDRRTGRFGTGIWIVNDQHPIFPLAAAWALPHPSNPYYHSNDVLEAVMAGGDALIEDQDERGMWVFRKKDGSTWGNIYQPWTYSRWIRAFGLIRDAMPPERRKQWERALTLGFSGISKTALDRMHNIPAHHAMALYHAGKVLDRPQWCDQARQFLAKICAIQDPGGYWPEHSGPAVSYNFVYSDAVGVYYAMSGDKTVLPPLARASAFHAAFTYPDGSRVETIDGRNPYHRGVRLGTVGFSFSQEGRSFLLAQWRRLLKAGGKLDADDAASFLLYGEEGPVSAPPQESAASRFVLGDHDALVHRRAPWFVSLSAFHQPVTENRWGQDRQNLVSLFHDRAGLIVGGGNTKLQPRWSTFSVGDTSLLFHRAGDTQPKFAPPPGLLHVPAKAQLARDGTGLELSYGSERCRVDVDTSDTARARLVYETAGASAQPVEAHVTLLPHLGEPWETASGRRGSLGEESFRLGPGEAGEWFSHHGWRISMPAGASVTWPVLPHNPYRKDGRAAAEEGLIVISLPFAGDVRRHELTVQVVH
jgi:hypothetical protein